MSEKLDATGMHLVIVVGGTGGHFFPACAIAEEFRNGGGSVTFVISGHNSQKYEKLAVDNEFAVKHGTSVRLPVGAKQALLFPYRFVCALSQSRKLLKNIQPTHVLGMGNFVSVPLCLMAKMLGIPVFLHEGNTIVGRANRWLSHVACAMGTSLPLARSLQPGCRTVETGFPLRYHLIQAAEKLSPEDARQRLGLLPDRFTLLVFGGSQGAQALNELMFSAAESLSPFADSLQVLHLTGQSDNEMLQEVYAKNGVFAVVHQWLQEMEWAYAAADLVLSRAGASSISEMALFGCTGVFVPLPWAADDHQTTNAAALEKSEAGVLLPQDEATPEALKALIQSRLDEPELWQKYADNVKQFAPTQATERMLELILRA